MREARDMRSSYSRALRSPDGSCFLTNSEDNNLRVFDLPSDVLENTDSYELEISDKDSFATALIINKGEAVYDFCWYSHMTTTDASTCTFATSTRDHPVHLWDAVFGQLRCTYRAYDAMYDIAAAYFIAFNNSESKYNKTLSRHGLSEYLKLAEIATILILGSVEDKRTFTTLSFMKDKLQNRLQTHLLLVGSMHAQKLLRH